MYTLKNISTSRVDVGTPPSTGWVNNFEGWTTINVCFHELFDNPRELESIARGECVVSPQFSCFGHQWTVGIYPYGSANGKEGYVDVSLSNQSNTRIKISFGFSVNDADGKEVVYHKPATICFGAHDRDIIIARRVHQTGFAKLSTLIDLSAQGSLVIAVRMKAMSIDKSITQFVPTNPLCKNVINMFMDDRTSDVVFEVDNESCQIDEHSNKKTKTTTIFFAHRFILRMVSTKFAELCNSPRSIVSITDVKPAIFRHMLYNAYGGKLSDEELKNNAKDIINACDHYGLVHLKLEAETFYVKSTTITMDNMMDNLLFADFKNLALLKEVVMDFIVANKGDIMGNVSFESVPSTMITDVLAAVARGEELQLDSADLMFMYNKKIRRGKLSPDYNKMRVGKLRKMLDEKGLDANGSRGAMIALLKEKNDLCT